MHVQAELERLMTLDRATIARVSADHTLIAGLITDCLDEALELDEQADDAERLGVIELAEFSRQEAAAWRATVTALRRLGAATHGSSMIQETA